MRSSVGGDRTSEYELPREINCLAIRRDTDEARYSLAAVGVKNVVKIIKVAVESEHHNVKVSEYTTATISRDGVITDVAWNPNQNSSFLLCHSKGIIKYFNIEANQAQYLGLASPWSYQHDDNYIIKLSWNANDRKLFGAAIRGAPVRLYDTSKPGSIGAITGKSARDIAFHPTLEDLLLVGEVDNVVKIFDRRKLTEPLYRLEAFEKSASLTQVAWYPYHDPMTFVASSANMVKVFQAKECLLDEHSFPSSSSTASAQPHAHHHHTGNVSSRMTQQQSMTSPSEIHKIYVPGTVKRLLADNEFITTLSSVGQDNDASSLLSVFDLDSSYTPKSVLRGQQVTCVDWLFQNNQQYLIWGGGDGRLSVRHPSLAGYHPREAINGNVATISSQGHLALHNPSKNGRIIFGLARFDDLDAAKQKKHGAEGTVSDPALLQLLAQSYRLPWNLAPVPRNKDNMNTNNNSNTNKPVMNGTESPLTSESAPLIEQELGSIDEANSGNQKAFQSVTNVNDISTNNSVVNIQLLRIRHRHARRFYREILRACQFNLLVAQRAGLHSRAAVWSALLALLPRPEDSFAAHLQLMQQQQDLKGYGSRSASNKNLRIISGSSASPSQMHSFSTSNGSSSSGSNSNSNNSVFCSLADAETLVQDMLRELLDAGDALHFVLVREILLRCQRSQAYAGLPSEISEQDAFQALSPIERLQERRVTQMYLAYADLLRRWTLPQRAIDIMKYVTDPVLIQRARADVTFKLSCALCSGTELRNRELRQRGSTAYCAKCKVSVSYCSVCCRPVTGLVQWCVVCGHGGHFHCLQQWFRSCRSQTVTSSSSGTATTPATGVSSTSSGAGAGMSSLVANTGGGASQINGTTMHSTVLSSTTSANAYGTAGGHAAASASTVVNTIQYTNSNNKACPSGCGHRCAAPKVSHSPYLTDDMRRYCIPLPHKIPASARRIRRSGSLGEAGGVGEPLNAQYVSGGGLASSISSTNLAGQFASLHAATPSNTNSGNNLTQLDSVPLISTSNQQSQQSQQQQQGYRAMTTLSAAEVRRNQMYRYMHSTYSTAFSVGQQHQNNSTTVGGHNITTSSHNTAEFRMDPTTYAA